MAYVFFRASEDALDNITASFDFVHTINASLRYTRSVLKDEMKRKGEITNEECISLIDPKKEVHGVNYTRAFFEKNISDHEEQLAWLLLNNLFAIHEGWAQRLYNEAFKGLHYDEYKFIKNLEFTGLMKKFSSYYMTINKKSLLMKNAFFSNYMNEARLDFSKLDNYMLCYRVFKEMRNCYMHHNSVASKQVVDCRAAN